jgi:hypothetical protein
MPHAVERKRLPPVRGCLFSSKAVTSLRQPEFTTFIQFRHIHSMIMFTAAPPNSSSVWFPNICLSGRRPFRSLRTCAARRARYSTTPNIQPDTGFWYRFRYGCAWSGAFGIAGRGTEMNWSPPPPPDRWKDREVGAPPTIRPVRLQSRTCPW